MFLILVLTLPLLVASPIPAARNNFTALTGIPSPVVAALFQTISYTPENALKTDSVVIPLKRAGRLLLIEASVDGETGNLVFDTGANGLVFSSTYFRNHVRSEVSSSNSINGPVGTVEQITIDKIEFANLTYKKIRADMTNLGHIENSRGIKIPGSQTREIHLQIHCRQKLDHRSCQQALRTKRVWHLQFRLMDKPMIFNVYASYQ